MSYGMPTIADDIIVSIRVEQAARRLARHPGKITPEVISGWTGWVGSWTSDWHAFSECARANVERTLIRAALAGADRCSQ